MTEITSRPAAVAMASAAIGTSAPEHLRAALEALGVIAAPARQGPRRSGTWRRPVLLKPLRFTIPAARTAGPHGPCPVPCCDRPAPAPGAPCEECMADLAGYVRPAAVGRAA